MAKRKTRASVGLVAFWSRQEHRRFIDAVERLVSVANDLGIIAARIVEADERRRRRRGAEVDDGASGPSAV